MLQTVPVWARYEVYACQCCAALQAMLERRRGRIVVISSMAGRIPSPGQALYSAA